MHLVTHLQQNKDTLKYNPRSVLIKAEVLPTLTAFIRTKEKGRQAEADDNNLPFVSYFNQGEDQFSFKR